MDPPASSRERLHGRSTCAEQGRTQSGSRCITTRPSACEGRDVSYGPRISQGICSLSIVAVLSSSSPTLLERAHVLQVVSGQVSREPSLFSHGQAKSITYTPGCTSSNSSRDHRPSCTAIVSRWWC